MIKKTISYEDLDGNMCSEDFYFHFNKAELIELNLGTNDLRTKIDSIATLIDDMKERNVTEISVGELGPIIAVFKEILQASIGQRSADGKRFVKNDDIRNDFMQSEAYSELFMELATDETAGAAFINGLIPSSLTKQMADVPLPATTEIKPPGQMSREELLELMRKQNNLPAE